MYQTLTFYHSIIRWLVLISLIYAIYRGYKGYVSNAKFSKTDNSVRHWTATIAHIQLLIGMLLYTQSPVTKYFWSNFRIAITDMSLAFFGLIHIGLMLAAIVVITIGSALAKRRQTDREKFSTLWRWFLVGLLIIVLAIPWPFSPFVARPYFR